MLNVLIAPALVIAVLTIATKVLTFPTIVLP